MSDDNDSTQVPTQDRDEGQKSEDPNAPISIKVWTRFKALWAVWTTQMTRLHRCYQR